MNGSEGHLVPPCPQSSPLWRRGRVCRGMCLSKLVIFLGLGGTGSLRSGGGREQRAHQFAVQHNDLFLEIRGSCSIREYLLHYGPPGPTSAKEG